MNIIVKLNKLEDINIIDNANSYLLANKDFSYRFDHSFSLDEISYIKKLTNKKVYALVNKIFKDEELESLEKYIKDLIDINIDGIFFADFACFMIAKKYNFENKMFFYHETFLRNSKDIETYQELGIKNIVISKDMNIDDIKLLDSNKKETYSILSFGYFPIYESERKVITNHLNKYNLDKSIAYSLDLYLKEDTRDNKYKVIEQNGITSIFESKPINYIDSLNILENYIDNIIIDAMFYDAKFIKDVVNAFINKDNSMFNMDDYTDGFLNKKVGLYE